MEDLNQSNIENFRRILKVTPKDSLNKININFDKFSVPLHPSIRKEAKYTDYFEHLVIAHEFLTFYHKNKNKFDDEQLIDVWNKTEKKRAESVLDEYRNMSLKEYKKAVEPKFIILSIFKSFISVLLGIGTLIGIFIIVLVLTSDALTAGGAVTFIAIIVVLVGYAFKGHSRINFWRKG